jgi:DNA polymerase-3 subunit delta
LAERGPSQDSLVADLREGNIAPVYLLHGEEEFLRSEAVDLVVSTVLRDADRSFNLDVLHGAATDAPSLIACASTFPMMCERRVVVVHDIDRVSGGEQLISYFDTPSPGTVHILTAGKPDLRKKLFLALKKNAVVIEFKKLYENQVPAWIERRSRGQGYPMDPDAARLLAEYTGNSLRDIQNELEKLYVYAGTGRSVTLDDVRTVTGISKEFNVFELQKAMGAKNKQRSMEILERILDQGEQPTRILWMIGRYYIALRKLSELKKKGAPASEQVAALGTKPYWLKDYAASLEYYTDAEIERAFLEIAQAELQLKTTSHEPKQILQCMTASLM